MPALYSTNRAHHTCATINKARLCQESQRPFDFNKATSALTSTTKPPPSLNAESLAPLLRQREGTAAAAELQPRIALRPFNFNHETPAPLQLQPRNPHAPSYFNHHPPPPTSTTKHPTRSTTPRARWAKTGRPHSKRGLCFIT